MEELCSCVLVEARRAVATGADAVQVARAAMRAAREAPQELEGREVAREVERLGQRRMQASAHSFMQALEALLDTLPLEWVPPTSAPPPPMLQAVCSAALAAADSSLEKRRGVEAARQAVRQAAEHAGALQGARQRGREVGVQLAGVPGCDGPAFLGALREEVDRLCADGQAAPLAPEAAAPDRGPSPGPQEAAAAAAAAGLNEEQRAALLAIVGGRGNVVVIGKGGSGKTHLLRAARAALEARGERCDVAAPTACAAQQVGGTTLQGLLKGLFPSKFRSGCWKGQEQFEKMVAGAVEVAASCKDEVRSRWLRLRVLFVDELSMVSQEHLELLHRVLGAVRRAPGLPFGGVRLVLIGDPAQLPPVEGEYVFMGPLWKKAAFAPVVLRRSMRQQGDAIFERVLDAVRFSERGDFMRSWDESLRSALLARCDPEVTLPEGAGLTLLRHTNAAVQKQNRLATEGLGGARASWTAQFELRDGAKRLAGPGSAEEVERELSTIREPWLVSAVEALRAEAAEEERRAVTLVEGAVAMVTANVDKDAGLINGAMGTVVSVTPQEVTLRLSSQPAHGPVALRLFERSQQVQGTVRLVVSFMPCAPAAALTVHKAQGQTLEAVDVMFAANMEPSLVYTALSRVRTLDALRIATIGASQWVLASSIHTHPDALAFLREVGAA